MLFDPAAGMTHCWREEVLRAERWEVGMTEAVARERRGRRVRRECILGGEWGIMGVKGIMKVQRV